MKKWLITLAMAASILSGCLPVTAPAPSPAPASDNHWDEKNWDTLKWE